MPAFIKPGIVKSESVKLGVDALEGDLALLRREDDDASGVVLPSESGVAAAATEAEVAALATLATFETPFAPNTPPGVANGDGVVGGVRE